MLFYYYRWGKNIITTIYLIRPSVRFCSKLIDSYNTNQDKLIKNEKIILSVSGEKRADILSKQEELQNIDKVYASNCVRTLLTAKYLLARQNLKVNIDDRLDERRVGIPNDDLVKDWFERQYLDENYKTINGESQKMVRDRMMKVLDEILSNDRGKKVAVFTHGYAITFLLLNWCKLEEIREDNGSHILKYSFNNKIIFDKKINSPEVFKLTFDEEKLINIENIVFKDLPYEDTTN